MWGGIFSIMGLFICNLFSAAFPVSTSLLPLISPNPNSWEEWKNSRQLLLQESSPPPHSTVLPHPKEGWGSSHLCKQIHTFSFGGSGDIWVTSSCTQDFLLLLAQELFPMWCSGDHMQCWGSSLGQLCARQSLSGPHLIVFNQNNLD